MQLGYEKPCARRHCMLVQEPRGALTMTPCCFTLAHRASGLQLDVCPRSQSQRQGDISGGVQLDRGGHEARNVYGEEAGMFHMCDRALLGCAFHHFPEEVV